jgi:hypothetical protein
MKKLFLSLVLVLSLSLCVNTIALGDPSSDSKQVQCSPPVVSVVERWAGSAQDPAPNR